jgi:hypothetical protein
MQQTVALVPPGLALRAGGGAQRVGRRRTPWRAARALHLQLVADTYGVGRLCGGQPEEAGALQRFQPLPQLSTCYPLAAVCSEIRPKRGRAEAASPTANHNSRWRFTDGGPI